MDIETNPALWADPLWSMLANARQALVDNPAILREKKHDWEGGLNSSAINRRMARSKASRKKVFEVSTRREGRSLVVQRGLRVNHPGAPSPIDIVTWDRYSPPSVPPQVVDRIAAYLRAWMDARAEAIAAEAAAKAPPTPGREDKLQQLERATPPLDTGNGQWVRSSTAAKLENVEAATLAKYRSKGLKNASLTLGQDPDGRTWRRSGSGQSHPWYLKSSLKHARSLAKP